MKPYHLKTHLKPILADTLTPVSIYLKIRDSFPNSILLESSDYHTADNSFSYICCQPIATLKLENNQVHTQFPDGTTQTRSTKEYAQITDALQEFIACFSVEKNPHKFVTNGLFGYMAYDMVQFFDGIPLRDTSDIPMMYYTVYQNIIVINHFKNEAFLICNSLSDSHNLEVLEQLIQNKTISNYGFTKQNETQTNCTDEAYQNYVKTAKEHCKRGDVFQLVLSKRFSQQFTGDEFNVYRALRSVNPSPYLFYFDFGNFKIFGSSPEAQLVIQNHQAEIHPIAGTFKRTGNDEQDSILAKKLSEDAKENAEHVMLVDLARNDLSRNCNEVQVAKYKEIQFFSHVIHLVSKVTGKLKNPKEYLHLVANTFPAGTLSGAPKHKAMQLISNIETHNRGFYGGAIGCLDFEGNFNHAIMIRTFLSKNQTLHFQAGAGIVESSIPENELNEVYNKLGALQKALTLAENI